ncbi:Lysine--tRNA ligase protein [Marine Group I thaumarchaeote SCGC AAA799-E16]|uniref:Lysine--tRNA ligase protein n=2 Tax=Marine Group I TaxID=905826 RepID=A0A087S185_9ARCH|nr:Lysine--tRNA ligase protein [Marine Group I thaumarchaeote SCGC AAA799-E16]KFM19489.1 Lysine--tRNA ligase protein [Marine Group I thaumarchaeote SCGC RSA3]
MNRISVSSSNIRSIGYDPDSETLEIEFHSGGIYQYFGVPSNVYDALMSASSHGGFFAANVKDNYRWQKIL